MILLVLIPVILLIALIVVAQKCLAIVIFPKRYSFPEMRDYEISKGFSDAFEKYDRVWNREDFSLGTNGIVIKGEIIRNDHPIGNKVAIIAHGHTANRYADLKYADLFYLAGYHVVIYDERHHGDTSGDICTLGQEEAKDLRDIFRFVRERFGNDCLIGLHGESMGAATSLLVLQYVRPDFVVADCPFADSIVLFTEFIRKNLHIFPSLIVWTVCQIARLRYRYDIKGTSPINAVKDSDVPICFMHGAADNLIDCHHSKDMFAVCKNENSELHLFEGADHACSITSDPKGYETILRDFLKRCNAL
ncbi:MAG: alpha/beta hydrolase [Erysipelotrichaceae bacterium]|nr:alpha/beta hydrolase [Erysipelotrichaceae bacterium]